MRLRLFRCKIFSTVKCFRMKMISGKMIFFSVFRCIPENAPKIFYSVVWKIEQKGVGGEACVFRKLFTKKLDVNYFPNFNKRFSGQLKLFSVWPPFYSETNTHKSKNIFRKIFYSETNKAQKKNFSFALSHFLVSVWYQNQKNILSFFIFWKGKKRIKTKALIIWVNYFRIYVGFPWVKFIHS